MGYSFSAVSGVKLVAPRRPQTERDVQLRAIGVDDRLTMLSPSIHARPPVSGRPARPVRSRPPHLASPSRRCRACHGWRGRWPGRRAVDGYQSRPMTKRTQEQGGIDVPIALAKAKIEPVGCRTNDVALSHPCADHDSCCRQAAVRGRAPVGLFDHQKAHTGDNPAESHDPGSRGDHARAGQWFVFQSAIARAVAAGWSAKSVDDRRRDRRLIAVGREQSERREHADHGRITGRFRLAR